jgi:hypothetical protein
MPWVSLGISGKRGATLAASSNLSISAFVRF